MKNVKYLVYLIAAILLGFFLLTLVSKDYLYKVVFTGLVYYWFALIICVLCLQASFLYGILYLYAMYRFQRFEFKRHLFRVGIMVYIMVGSLTCICIYWYMRLEL
jgi:hypothetical protein